MEELLTWNRIVLVAFSFMYLWPLLVPSALLLESQAFVGCFRLILLAPGHH